MQWAALQSAVTALPEIQYGAPRVTRRAVPVVWLSHRPWGGVGHVRQHLHGVRATYVTFSLSNNET